MKKKKGPTPNLAPWQVERMIEKAKVDASNEAKMICQYIKSISFEEDSKRLLALHEAIQEIMGDCALDDVDVRKSADRDIRLVEEKPEGGI